MTATSSGPCPACGAAASGRFCSSCGAALEGGKCRGCGAALPPKARFCQTCGLPRDGAPRLRAPRAPWLVAGVAVVVLLGVLIALLARQQPVPVAASSAAVLDDGGGGALPDLSQMSPRERFDRLYNRVMRSAQSGDEGTVTQFTPMALLAYAQLDSVDADARYHAALLRVHTGDVDAALALADTILARQPTHLFGFIVRGTVARWRKDDRALRSNQRGFLSHYDAEMKLGRPEYGDHKSALDEFRATAIKDTKAN